MLSQRVIWEGGGGCVGLQFQRISRRRYGRRSVRPACQSGNRLSTSHLTQEAERKNRKWAMIEKAKHFHGLFLNFKRSLSKINYSLIFKDDAVKAQKYCHLAKSTSGLQHLTLEWNCWSQRRHSSQL